MTIAITGATGQLGQLTIQSLLKKTSAQDIVAVVRNPAKASTLSDLGVDVRQANYTNIETLSAAFAGVEKLLLISSSEVGQRAAQHQNVIDAAKNAGVKHIVYTSILHADTSPLALAEEHVITEQAIKASGLTYTLLRNSWYTENYTGNLKAAVEHGVILGAAGDGKIASAARQDYADAAATVLSSEGHDNTTYELAGDQAYTLSELAALVSELSGKTVQYHNLSEQEYAQKLVELGLHAGFADILADSDIGASQGALFDNSQQLHQLIGRDTTPLTELVKQALA
jgi:NAD(P)H dehydrogenase (quinone)